MTSSIARSALLNTLLTNISWYSLIFKFDSCFVDFDSCMVTTEFTFLYNYDWILVFLHDCCHKITCYKIMTGVTSKILPIVWLANPKENCLRCFSPFIGSNSGHDGVNIPCAHIKRRCVMHNEYHVTLINTHCASIGQYCMGVAYQQPNRIYCWHAEINCTRPIRIMTKTRK